MKFRIRRREMIHAALLGLLTGIFGVLLFILLLNSMDSKIILDDNDEEKIPVAAETENNNANVQEGSYELFYANQHGVFSTHEAAREFVSNYPSLNTSAIIEIDGNFYVWSSVAPSKEDLVQLQEPSSFSKPFKFSGKACKKKELQQLPTILKSNDKSKIYFEDKKSNQDYPSDWEKITVALTSLSEELSVIRMHLLAHYFSENDCLKIEF